MAMKFQHEICCWMLDTRCWVLGYGCYTKMRGQKGAFTQEFKIGNLAPIPILHYPASYQFTATCIPSGLLSNPRYKVPEGASQETSTSVIFSPLSFVMIVSLGAAGNNTRILFLVFAGLLQTNEYFLPLFCSS